MQGKRIGIDARFLGEAGPGRYVKNIVENLEILDPTSEYFIFLRKKGFSLYNPKAKNFTKVLADYPWYSWSEQILFLLKILSFSLDIFYVPHFNIPVLYPKTIVTAIPDIIMHSFSTEKGTTLPKPYFKFKKFIYKLVVWWAVIRSKKVIVPSLDVVSDFLKAYPHIHKDKYILAYEGVDQTIFENEPSTKDVLEKYQIKKPFLLYVSSMYEHKNVPRLVRAFKLLKEEHQFAGKLVLIGKKDNFSKAIAQLIKETNLEEAILMPGMHGYVTDGEVTALRKSASLYVFPSLKEGFSLTPMEAQSVGLPAVISDIPCHREIYEDSVYYFDPYSEKDIAEKINDVLQSEKIQKNLVAKGYENIKKYDWKKTARITLEVYENYAH